jgi:hypothetical protein
LLPGSTAITELIAELYNAIRPLLLVDPKQLLLHLEAYLLSRRIIVCHYELAEAFRSILRRKDIESVKESLEDARRTSITGEDEYNALIEFIELRNKVLHYGRLSLNEKDVMEPRMEINVAWRVIKCVINEVKLRELEDFVGCLQEPLHSQFGY